MSQDEKRPLEGGTKFQEDAGQRRKDSEYLAEKQLIAPCFSCPLWHSCGRLAWTECGRFGRFITEYKEARWLGQRAAREMHGRAGV